MSLAILLVEPDPDLARELERQLGAAGHRMAAVAATAAEACRLHRSLDPDLVLMEMLLPDRDGIQAAREMNQLQPLPVVLLTSLADRHLLAGAREAGVYSYLIKPVEPQVLGPALELAWESFQRLDTWQRRIGDLRRELEERRQRERAKGLVMARLGLDSNQAQALIQEQMRRHGCGPAEAAARILGQPGREEGA